MTDQNASRQVIADFNQNDFTAPIAPAIVVPILPVQKLDGFTVVDGVWPDSSKVGPFYFDPAFV